MGTLSPRYRHPFAIAFAIASICAVGGCGGAAPPAAAPAPVTVTATPQQPAAPAPVTVTATPAPAVVAPPAEPTKAPTKPKKKTPAKAAEVTFEMPDVVGMVLQDAQDLLQTKGSYIMDQQDATGLERLQILDSNWTVCAQRPKRGVAVSTDDIVTLSSVKLYEDCP
jgi:hypothetical protein